MFSLINAESLWIGTDLKKVTQIKEQLDSAGIPYKEKVKNRLGEWNGSGTVRGNVGNLGTPAGKEYEYEILVYKKDLDYARHLI